MIQRKHRLPRMSDREVKGRVEDAVARLTIAGRKVNIGTILAECEGASRARFRTAIDRLLRTGDLAERRTS